MSLGTAIDFRGFNLTQGAHSGRMTYFSRITLAAALAASFALGEPPQAVRVNRLPLQTKIQDGKDRQVDLLFDGPRRRLIQITLRNGAVLSKHTAPVPITIQGIAGRGTLYCGEEREAVVLEPGVLVTLEPNVLHEIQAGPAVSFLLTQFTGN